MKSFFNFFVLQLTPDGKQQKEQSEFPPARAGIAPQPSQEDDEENFFEQLSRFQSERMDDQRCDLIIRKPALKKSEKAK